MKISSALLARLQKLKLVVSLSFLIFMFLPLTECSSIEEGPAGLQNDAAGLVDATPAVEELPVPSKEEADEEATVIPEEAADSSEPAVEDQLVAEEDSDSEFVWLLAYFGVFIFPFATCFIRPRAFNPMLASNLFQLFVAIGFSYLVYWRVYDFPFGTPVLSGHIFMCLSVIFALLSITTLVCLVGSKGAIKGF